LEFIIIDEELKRGIEVGVFDVSGGYHKKMVVVARLFNYHIFGYHTY
jgi:hypothetical protein